jgi:hypothetical protein
VTARHHSFPVNTGLSTSRGPGAFAVRRAGVVFGSVEQNRLWGGCPALGQRVNVHGGGPGIQVVEDLLDDGRVFDAGDDLYRSAALATSFDVEVEYALQALCPRHRSVALGRGVVGDVWRLALAARFDMLTAGLAAFCRGDLRAVFTVEGKNTVKSDEVHSGLGHQGGQPGDEIQGLKEDTRGAVAVRGLELVLHLTVRGERQAFLGDSRSFDVAAQTFEFVSLPTEA